MRICKGCKKETQEIEENIVYCSLCGQTFKIKKVASHKKNGGRAKKVVPIKILKGQKTLV